MSASHDPIVAALEQHICSDILGGRLGRALDPDEDLLADDLVDSLGMMQIVVFVQQRFGIEVPPEDVTFESFSTIARIAGYIGGRGG